MTDYATNSSEHRDLVHTLLSILREWQVEPEQQIILLGMPNSTKARALNRVRAGEPLPECDRFLERAHFLLAIQNAVSSMYPHNAQAANYWVSTPSFFFGNYSPLQIMLNEGVAGMQRVLNNLNGIDDWG